jgi:hypothetical protein
VTAIGVSNQNITQSNTVINGNGGIQTKTIHLTSAQVLSAYTTPIAFGITVPTGYYAWPLAVSSKIHFNTTPYATNIVMTLGYAGDPINSLYYVEIDDASDSFEPFLIEYASQITPEADLAISIGDGNPTAGNSPISIVLTYILLPTP